MTPDDKIEIQEQEQEIVAVEETAETAFTGEEPEAPEAAQLAAAVSQVDRKVYGGMFAMPEVIGLGFAGLILLIILGFYFLALAPAQSDLKNKKARLDELEKKLVDAKSKFGNITQTEEKVAYLIQSVTDFEYRHLPISSIGRTALYDRLNGLMAAYNLRNTAGPEYSPLEIKEFRPDQPQEERGRSKFESLFPGDYINMTIEGSYVNMRRFMRELEASQQFVVISSVELEAAENSQDTARNPGAPPAGIDPATGQPVQSVRPKGKTHGETVSLHLELAAYFRREAAPAKSLTPVQTSGTGK
jgi:Tfp pilus assembly protein PilO